LKHRRDLGGIEMPNRELRDRYGGCAGMSFDATGFFRLEKTDRWWFVTPDGHAHLSFGLNHVEPGLMQRGENRAYWQAAFGLEEDAGQETFLRHFRGRVKQDLQAFGCHYDELA
jgi:hypothetical protein